MCCMCRISLQLASFCSLPAVATVAVAVAAQNLSKPHNQQRRLHQAEPTANDDTLLLLPLPPFCGSCRCRVTISKQINSCCRRKRAAPYGLKSNCERSKRSQSKQIKEQHQQQRRHGHAASSAHLCGICSAGFACRKKPKQTDRETEKALRPDFNCSACLADSLPGLLLLLLPFKKTAAIIARHTHRHTHTECMPAVAVFVLILSKRRLQ